MFGIDPRTVAKMLACFGPHLDIGAVNLYDRPKLDAFTGIIDQNLEADKLVHKKQRHTSKRIFERLRDEHGFDGGITIVKDYIFAAQAASAGDVCSPCLTCRRAMLQAGFWRGCSRDRDVERKIHFLVMELAHISDAFFEGVSG